MENNYQDTSYEEEFEQPQGSVLSGLVGALLATVIGALFWAAIGVLTGYVFSIAGFAIGLIVCAGYDLFKGRKCWARPVIVAICIVLAVCAGDIAGCAWRVHGWYQEEVDLLENGTPQELAEYFLTEEEQAVFNTLPAVMQRNYFNDVELIPEGEYFQLYLQDPEFTGDVMKGMLQSSFYGLLGGALLISRNAKQKKKEEEEAESAMTANGFNDMDSAETSDNENTQAGA